MRKLILITFLFSLLPLEVFSIKRIEANPINIAYMLAQDTDSASIAKTLAYYGYQPVEGNSASAAPPHPQRFNTERSSDTALANTPYSTYRHPNGSIIRYSFKHVSQEQPYPIVEVKSKLSSKEIDSILTDLRFDKQGSSYVRKVNQYARTILTCKHGSAGYIIFHQSRILFNP